MQCVSRLAWDKPGTCALLPFDKPVEPGHHTVLTFRLGVPFVNESSMLDMLTMKSALTMSLSPKEVEKEVGVEVAGFTGSPQWQMRADQPVAGWASFNAMARQKHTLSDCGV
ncbi:hypothetical protein AcV7_001784 [Taiwanofungus camphoratus]|nr:hypothetical protein AcV7_001784 [Antrodia cinnamomea]